MGKRIIICTAALLLVVSLLFSGCKRGNEFEKIDVPSTEEVRVTETQTTEPVSEGIFTFAASIKMGMTVQEVQRAIGQVADVGIVDNRKSFSNEFSGVFINYTTVKNVIFMFDINSERLEQMQFRCNTNTDGADTETAIKLFDARYGKQAVYQGNYINRIWKSDDVYILLSELDENNYAVTYTQKDYFASHYAEEAAAFERVQ